METVQFIDLFRTLLKLQQETGIIWYIAINS